MGIEKDIQQYQFRNDFQRAEVNLIFTCNWLNERIKLIIDEADITTQQYNILRILRGSKKPLSTLQIRDRMLDKMSDTSRIVDRLIKKQLVDKTICATDKRLVDISISEKGLHLLEQLDIRNSDIDNLLHNLNNEEALQLSHLLDKIRERPE
ncbi:MAG: MarR family transcriptional regulator [Bacteroidetes bacterium]|nr:MarR family transcriptional regulator [Bacteroidota bacterium]